MNLKSLLLVISLIAVIVLVTYEQRSDLVLSIESKSSDQFSADNALASLKQIIADESAHPTDSPAIREVESNLVELLNENGFEVDVQESRACNDYKVGIARCAKVRNLIVQIAGQSNREGILLSAHYDSVAASPGVSDAGVAVASLVEVAKLVRANGPYKRDVVLLFVEGEEYGLFGAKAFMDNHPLAKKVKVAINIEARGTSGQSVMFETGDSSGWLVEKYADVAENLWANSLFYEVYKFLPNNTDFTVYKEAGLSGLNFANAENIVYYHTSLDNFENLNIGSLQHHGQNVWRITNHLANAEEFDSSGRDLVFTDIMGSFLVSWDKAKTIYIAIFLSALLAVVIYLLTRSGSITVKGVIKGAFASIIVIVLTLLAMQALQILFSKIMASNSFWRLDSRPVFLAAYAISFLICYLVSIRVARNNTAMSMFIGVLVTTNLLCVLASIFMPGISYIFIIPLLVVEAILLLSTLIKGLPANRANYPIIANSIMVALIVVPIINILNVMVGFSISVLVGLMLALIAISLMPFFVVSHEQSKPLKKIAVASFVIFCAAAVLTTSQEVYSTNAPEPVNIQYVELEDDAYIVLNAESGGVEPAIAATLPEVSKQAVIPWNRRAKTVARSPFISVEGTQLSVLSSQDIDGGRVINLSLSTKASDILSRVSMFIPEQAGLKSISFNSEELLFEKEKPVRNGYYEFSCFGMSCTNLTLALSVTNQNSIDVLLATRYHGLPEQHEAVGNARNDSAIPRNHGDETIKILEEGF